VGEENEEMLSSADTYESRNMMGIAAKFPS
jgi:hypothetical protein